MAYKYRYRYFKLWHLYWLPSSECLHASDSITDAIFSDHFGVYKDIKAYGLHFPHVVYLKPDHGYRLLNYPALVDAATKEYADAFGQEGEGEEHTLARESGGVR